MAVIGGVGAGVTFARAIFTTPAEALPAHLHRHLDKGRYEIFQKVASQSDSTFPTSQHDFASLVSDDVHVQSVTGAPVAVEPVGEVSETVTRGTRVYGAAVVFDVPRDDDYVIDIRYSGGQPEVIITRTLGGAARAAGSWLVLLAVGVVAATIGLVLLI